MNTMILRLAKSGYPLAWVSKQEAACLWVKEQIIWSHGDNTLTIKGGYNCMGERSIINLPSMIATAGAVTYQHFVPPLNNRYLFRRDQHTCLYCGHHYHPTNLSCDHVKPIGQGGKNVWTNVVTACKRCNNHKACRTPEQAGMKLLLAIPYEPNLFEFLYLANKNILADQMEFLRTGFSDGCQLTE